MLSAFLVKLRRPMALESICVFRFVIIKFFIDYNFSFNEQMMHVNSHMYLYQVQLFSHRYRKTDASFVDCYWLDIKLLVIKSLPIQLHDVVYFKDHI